MFRSGPDLERFYGEVLKLPLERRGRRSAEVDLGGASLHLHETLDEGEQSAWGLPGRTEVLSFEVDDLDEMYRRLTEAGAKVRLPPRDAPWGGRLMLAEDPGGHLLEFSQP